jgi:hypothetical protein
MLRVLLRAGGKTHIARRYDGGRLLPGASAVNYSVLQLLEEIVQIGVEPFEDFRMQDGVCGKRVAAKWAVFALQ